MSGNRHSDVLFFAWKSSYLISQKSIAPALSLIVETRLRPGRIFRQSGVTQTPERANNQDGDVDWLLLIFEMLHQFDRVDRFGHELELVSFVVAFEQDFGDPGLSREEQNARGRPDFCDRNG